MKVKPSTLYNLNWILQEYAISKGLEREATGGGMDFIMFQDETDTFILSDIEDPTEGDLALDEPAQWSWYTTKDWGDGGEQVRQTYNFRTTREAIDWLNYDLKWRK